MTTDTQQRDQSTGQSIGRTLSTSTLSFNLEFRLRAAARRPVSNCLDSSDSPTTSFSVQLSVRTFLLTPDILEQPEPPNRLEIRHKLARNEQGKEYRAN